MHTGVKYSEMNNAQPSTVVARNTSITDIIIPTKNIRYESGQHGGWITDPLFVNIAKDKEKLDYVSKLFIGRTVKIVLPIQIQETVNEYIFSFNIASFKSFVLGYFVL